MRGELIGVAKAQEFNRNRVGSGRVNRKRAHWPASSILYKESYGQPIVPLGPNELVVSLEIGGLKSTASGRQKYFFADDRTRKKQAELSGVRFRNHYCLLTDR